MQPFPSPTPPDRPGRLSLIALLVVGFLVASTIAVIELVKLGAADERIEELESGAAPSADGGQSGELGDIVKDLLGEAEGLFPGAGELGSLLACLGNPLAGTGEAGTSVDEIARQVEGIRELAFDHDVAPVFLSDREMNDRVRELFLREYTPEIAATEQRLLTILGAIPPGTDLRRLRADAIGEQVAGFYDPDTGELVVRQSGAALSAIDRITLSHELDHALTDQALGIPLPDEPEIGREDADLAALALVEGDATLVMQRYSATLGLDEQLQLLDPEAIAQSEAGLGDFPPYLEQELRFPYEEGMSFVCDLYAEGGWEAVDRAYADPPVSTAQVLFPQRYLASDEPVEPRSLDALGRPWRRSARLQLGAANLLWLFSAPGGDRAAALPDPLSRVAGWGGGEVELWVDGSRTAVGISIAPDPTASDAGLCNSVDAWYRASVPGDVERAGVGPWALVADGATQDAVLACELGSPRLGIAPDLRTARALAR